ncbi:MAG TPA: two-component regulator propeller domain-containing protein [Bryobacteraceae bacterium]|nr:two-component regulator propeller domain-containing protein [Bryobacteraceae bacterium]
MMAGILLVCPRAFALDSALDASQYAHSSWKVRDGFVKGVISSLAQTSDGYLWLGTEFGLERFDGVRAAAWNPPPGQHLPSARIFSMLAARDGTLWIGTSNGLASWKDGRLTQYPELAGQAIRAAILEDRDGTIWAGGLASSSAGKLCAFRQAAVQCYGEDGTLDGGVTALYEDHERNLWVGVRNGLFRWKPGPPAFYPATAPAANGGGIQGIAESGDGALLFGSASGTRRVTQDQTEAYPLPGTRQQVTALRLLRDGDGSLWIGTSDAGLAHVHSGRTDVFAQAGGLSGDFVTALFIDREGTLWVATDGGLDRFREFAVPTLSLGQGLSNASILSVLAARDGSVWLSTRRGLNRWSSGQISVFGLLHGAYAGSMFQDSRGRIWASTLREFGYLENNRFVPVKDVPGGAVYSICEDRNGNLWIANRAAGLIQLSRNGQVQQTPWTALGHKDPAMALAPDPTEPGLWIGFNQGGIAKFRDGKVTASYSAADGLGEGRVNGLRFDPDGALWAATEGGLSRFKNGRIATLAGRNGLPCDSVHWMMEDDDHSFWLYTTCGLVRVARAELDAWAAATDHDPHAARAIHATVFDSSDGVRSLEENGGYTPHVAKSADGRLWFLPSDGASIVDPHHLPYNHLLPPVHIALVTADRKTYQVPTDEQQHLRLPALVRDLTIDYTALSLVAPEKVHFRYRLEGRDLDWRDDTGNRRQAVYNDLPPRKYRFRVIACNNSGVWNESGASLDFSIAPALYQATWFQVLCAAGVLALLGALYRLRQQQVARQFQIRMEVRLNERTRIARELHDTMLQSFQAVLMKFHAVTYLLDDHAEARDALEGVIVQARQAVIEGREAVQGLRSSTQVTNDLALAIGALGEALAAELDHDVPEFRVRVEGTSRDLAPLVRDDIHRIACEAVRNAFRHALARHIEVEIRYDRRHLRLQVLDNGRGIDDKVLSAGGRPGHFGLAGMRERAQSVGGRLAIRRGPDSGTEIELTIAASVAYGKLPVQRSMSSGKGS